MTVTLIGRHHDALAPRDDGLALIGRRAARSSARDRGVALIERCERAAHFTDEVTLAMGSSAPVEWSSSHESTYWMKLYAVHNGLFWQAYWQTRSVVATMRSRFAPRRLPFTTGCGHW